MYIVQNKEITEFFQYDSMVQKYFLEDLNNDFPNLVKNVENKIFATQLLYRYVYDLALVGKQFINSNMRKCTKLREIADNTPANVQVSAIGISEEYRAQNTISIPTLTFCTTIYSTDINFRYREKIGNIIISINLEKISEQFSQGYDNNISFVLLDKRGEHYPINCSREMAEQILHKVQKNGRIESVEVSNKNSLTYTSYIPAIESHLISHINIKSSQRGIGYLRISLMVVFALTILVICMGFIVIYKKMITPISTISHYMNRVSTEGYISVKDRVQIYGNTEIVDLAHNLNHMIDEICKLTKLCDENCNQSLFVSLK